MVAAYEEARRVTEVRGVRIRNATIGGKLEVFERVDYESLFRAVANGVEPAVWQALDGVRRGVPPPSPC
jgi:hypothetical protein